MLRHELRAALTALMLASTLGCGATAYNVRAYRTYAYEQPEFAVALDRSEDLTETLALIDRVLVETPYTPGAHWIKRLPLTDAEASRIREEVRQHEPYTDSNHMVPLLKLYRVHLEEVLKDAPKKADAPANSGTPGDSKPASDSSSGGSGGSAGSESGSEPKKNADSSDGEPKKGSSDGDKGAEQKDAEKAAADGTYPSILAALSSLSKKGGELSETWVKYQNLPKELEKAKKERDDLQAAVPTYQTYYNLSDTQREQIKVAEAKVKVAKEKIEAIEKEMKANKTALIEAVRSAAQQSSDNKDRKQILNDAETVLSVAYRLDLEALALFPIVAVQLARSLPDALYQLKAGKLKHGSFKTVEQLEKLPDNLSQVEDRLAWQVPVVEAMADGIAKSKGQEATQGPAFASLRESIVDQVVGITRDSFRFNLNAGAEALFFEHSVGDTKESSSSNNSSSSSSSNDKTITKDFTGRSRRLDYKVKPILMANLKLNVGFDWLHLPNAGNLDLGYTTDRMWSSGGSINTSNQLGPQLGLKGAASDALDMGLGILGVRTAVRVAKFTTGEIRLRGIETTNDQLQPGVIDTAPLQLTMTQIDVGYDLAFLFAQTAGKIYLENFTVGFRHMRYKLPRILYELEDQNPDSKTDNYTFLRQSPVQNVESKYYMGGFMARFGPGTAPMLSWFVDLGIYFGGGPAAYYFCPLDTADPLTATPEACDNEFRQHYHKDATVVNGGMGAGLRLRVNKPTSTLKLYAEASYRGDVIYSTISAHTAETTPNDPNNPDSGSTETSKNRVVEFGGADVFHGPRFTLFAQF